MAKTSKSQSLRSSLLNDRSRAVATVLRYFETIRANQLEASTLKTEREQLTERIAQIDGQLSAKAQIIKMARESLTGALNNLNELDYRAQVGLKTLSAYVTDPLLDWVRSTLNKGQL